MKVDYNWLDKLSRGSFVWVVTEFFAADSKVRTRGYVTGRRPREILVELNGDERAYNNRTGEMLNGGVPGVSQTYIERYEEGV